MTLVIQRAVLTDAPALVEAQVSAFNNDAVIYPGVAVGGPPGYDSVNVMEDKIREHHGYAFRVDGAVIGGMVVMDLGSGHYHLDVLFITPAFHNQGMGTQAMAYMEAQYPKARLWTLNTPAWAVRNRHFYEKHGYVRVDEWDLNGIPLIDYEKRI
jgi:GNAT superfamily N-acetyltransferase